MAKRKSRGQPAPAGAWESVSKAVASVLIASMNKGQFPLAIVALLLAVLICRMPPEEAAKLAFRILERIESGVLTGYVLTALALAGWFTHVRIQRRVITSEMKRVAGERNKWQERHLGSRLPSSEPSKKP